MSKKTFMFDEISDTTLILSTIEGPRFLVNPGDYSVTVGWSPTDTLEIEENGDSIIIRHLASGRWISGAFRTL